MSAKPSIVLAHGIWADGSCFNKLIPPLQEEGYEVIAAQYALDRLAGDVEAVKRTLGRGGPFHSLALPVQSSRSLTCAVRVLLSRATVSRRVVSVSTAGGALVGRGSTKRLLLPPPNAAGPAAGI